MSATPRPKQSRIDVTSPATLTTLATKAAGGNLSCVAGWTVMRVERGRDGCNGAYNFYLDPYGTKFRSVAEVTRHLHNLAEAPGGGESHALVVSTPIVTGSAVWAKMASYPPWPAVVTSLDGGTAEVQFFATDDVATLRLANLKPYTQTAGWQPRERSRAFLDGNGFHTAVELADRHIAEMDGLACEACGRGDDEEAMLICDEARPIH
jgi:hypothetical protein